LTQPCQSNSGSKSRKADWESQNADWIRVPKETVNQECAEQRASGGSPSALTRKLHDCFREVSVWEIFRGGGILLA
jgi:hypothetical protein